MSETVLLLHGLMMRGPMLLPLAGRLRRRGFRPLLFGYPTLWKAPSRAMDRLAMRLYEIGQDPVHIVAHSLGGLIAIETLNRYQQLPSGRVVCLGAPIAGSSAARGLADKGFGFVAGKSGPLLRGGLIQLPERRQIGAVAGSRSMGLGKYFGGLDGINDGTVGMWETRLPGLTDHVVVPASHSGLILSPRVAEVTANFLETGRFQP